MSGDSIKSISLNKRGDNMPRRLTQCEYDEKLKSKTSQIIRIDPYINGETPTKHKCLRCGYEWNPQPRRFNNTCICPNCDKYGVGKLIVGKNDLWTTRPDVANLLLNKDDGYKYFKTSKEKLKFVCPDCGNIMLKSISNVCEHGLSCNVCKDYISYPNKFMYNIFNQMTEQYDYLQREYRDDWCVIEYDNKKHICFYDFYIKIGTSEIVVEMDGNFHYQDSPSIKVDKQIMIDNLKTKLAQSKDIIVIRIDCNYRTGKDDRFEYVKNNILNSDLIKYFNFSSVDFNLANDNSNTSNYMETVNLWNNGYSVLDISLKFNVTPSTIVTYLKNGNKQGLCKYNKRESYERSSHYKSVILLNTNEVFKTIREGANKYQVNESSVVACCKGRRKTVKSNVNGEKLIWRYFDESLTEKT